MLFCATKYITPPAVDPSPALGLLMAPQLSILPHSYNMITRALYDYIRVQAPPTSEARWQQEKKILDCIHSVIWVCKCITQDQNENCQPLPSKICYELGEAH